MTDTSNLIARLSAASGAELLDFTNLPYSAGFAGEHYDGGWVPDCGDKKDYDPGLMRFSCRVWPDATYDCSLYFGDNLVVEKSGILRAKDILEARSAVEAWCAERAEQWKGVVIAALKAIEDTEGAAVHSPHNLKE